MSERQLEISGLVDHLFRRKSGQMVSILTRILGPANLATAEESVQEALLRALQTWPTNGIPGNPGGWLMQVARNAAFDRVRRQTRFAEKLLEIQTHDLPPDDVTATDVDGPVHDDELRMLLLCCHPLLPREARGALTLKTVGGFSVDEISRAFLSKKTTVAQRLVRAKRLLREQDVPFELPEGDDLLGRIESGLEVLYLMFNEGYAAHQGDDLVRSDLCQEAIRLATILAQHPMTAMPEVHALLSLMLLQASRLPARLDADGAMVLLADQDRHKWDRGMIGAGFRSLERACTGTRQTEYHLQAGIAAAHAAALSYEDTNWEQVLRLYDRLSEANPSPVVELNRAVAVAQIEGAAAGIQIARGVEGHPALRDYYLLPATLGDLFARLEVWDVATAYFERAITLPCSDPEKRFLQKQRRYCEAKR
jgi:RNA polymerase sigma-70 factor (ECF subfamily)